MNKVVTIDGVKHLLIEVPKPKYEVGDWVKVIANKTDIQEKDSYIGKTFKIEGVFEPGGYARKGDDTLYAYGIGEIAETYVVFEDELEPAEEPWKNAPDPFDIEDGEQFYWIDYHGEALIDRMIGNGQENRCVAVANACTDEALMKQRALHEVLNRLLWRASERAGEPYNEWDFENRHYSICLKSESEELGIDYSISRSIQGVCYFPTCNAAESALENIVKPFMKEHPDFVW